MIKLDQLLDTIEFANFFGDKAIYIKEVLPLTEARHSCGTITWTRHIDNPILESINETTLICPPIEPDRVELFREKGINLIISNNPRRSFLQVLKCFVTEPEESGIELSAHIHSSVKIGSNCYIGHNVVIEAHSVIGNDVILLHNTVIKSKSNIGDRVKVGCNNTIGGVGFGYELSEDGQYDLIPHIGGVIIENDVEIGNNTCIDRAVLGNTVLHKNVKVDNLVHIAHGCEIGENSLVIANAMIAGSVKVGRNSWIAPSASIMNKLSVADDSLVGMGSVVIKDVKEGEVVAGNPGKVLKKKGN